MLLEINNPKPVPGIGDFVANFVNNLGNIFGCIPLPVSLTLTRISISNLLLGISYFLSTITVILPSSVNLMALFNKL